MHVSGISYYKIHIRKAIIPIVQASQKASLRIVRISSKNKIIASSTLGESLLFLFMASPPKDDSIYLFFQTYHGNK
jgi:hypothetical protein